ncbi:MAG: protoporphyrinogen oxidase, partial [Acidimicrobiia bacterium]|nr:protoporphyrinogen oxidase [Acidimicrobiia bacterium]
GTRPGGVAATITEDGYTLEPAAGSFLLPQPGLTPLVVGEVEPAAPSARVRHIWDGQRRITITPGPQALLAPLVSPVAKLRAAAEVLVPGEPVGPDESLDRFLRRRFGDEAGRTAAWLAASGVFAGDPALLSADAAFPTLTSAAAGGSLVLSMLSGRQRATPRTMYVPRTTMTDLAEALARPLGDRLRLSATVDAVRRDGSAWVIDGTERLTADHVVLTTSPDATAGIVGSELGSLLTGPVRAPVVVVGLGGSGLSVPEGFGILAGPDAGTATRGVLLESSYAHHRAPAGTGLVKVIAGGLPDPSITEEDDHTVVETVGTEVARMLGHDIEVSFTRVVRHSPGIPQYTLGHRDWLHTVESAVPESLHLTGWGYRGVGLGHLAADAARVADRIAAA